MKLEGMILCLGEESKFKIYWNDVVVYPARMEDGLEEAMRAVEDGTEALQVGGGTELPVYGEHASKVKQSPQQYEP
jgi:hypothetical protein